MKARYFLLPILISFIFHTISYAQFYTVGDNPASVRWSSTETPHYRIVYPEGLDSLAMAYGRNLEKYRIPVGRTAGYTPGECIRVKMPVILHAFNAQSNGSVAWAPKRISLFTSPQPYDPEAMPWATMLAIHEQRHAAQMQTGLSGAFRPFGWFFGEMFNGLVAGLYFSNEMLEGDAVIAETALSRSGRGRTADFLNYYMIAFDNGDFRNWNKWRFGSQRNNTLNHYAAGYLMFSGIRYLYGTDDFVGQYTHHISRRPYDVNGFETVLKKTTGKNLKTAYKEIADTLNRMWQEEIEARKPFIPSSEIMDTPTRYTEYYNNIFCGDDLFTVREGKSVAPALVKISPAGKMRIISSFPHSASQLCLSEQRNRIYWSETVPDIRWGQKKNSLIRYYDTKKHIRRTITHQGRLFSPSISEDGTYLCTSEYFDRGNTGLAILDPDNGEKTASVTAPDSLQVTTSTWIKDRIYVTAVSEHGYGIYSIGFEDNRFKNDWKTVLCPQPVQITNFGSEDGMLYFTSDRTGVNEYYRLDADSGELVQLTSTRYGANDFVYSPSGEYLYYSAERHGGKLIEKTPSDSLLEKRVDFADIHKYRVADKLSLQEKKRAESDTTSAVSENFEFTPPERYRRFPHLLKIHSWAPFYFDSDNLKQLSGDRFYEVLSLGAAAISQNDLDNAIASFGYSAHKDPYNYSRWRHSGHIKFTYTGWYPVIELALDINDRGARTRSINYNYTGVSQIIGTQKFVDPEYSYISSTSKENGHPFISGKIAAYIPFNFSKGGWYQGLIPRVSYTITNDRFKLDPNTILYNGSGHTIAVIPSISDEILVQSLNGSVRYYIQRPVAEAGVYPKWGIGTEFGASYEIGLEKFFSPVGYGYVYGYLPGIIPQHGLRLTATVQSRFNTESISGLYAAATVPRGFRDNGHLISYISNVYSTQTRMTADYAIPIYIGDISLGSFLYIKRIVLTPHFDYTLLGTHSRTGLYSTGASLTINFSSLFWLKYSFNIGVEYSYNGGNAFNSIKQSGIPMGRDSFQPIFSVDF